MIKNFLLIIFFGLVSFSCTTARVNELDYLKNIESISTDKALETQVSTLQRGDELVIVVSARDQDVVKPFNKNYSSSQIVQEPVPGGNTLGAAANNTSTGPTYIVDNNGQIDFPIVGVLNTEGKSLAGLKSELEEKISVYVRNPTVTVKITNFKVTILGEVSKPGEYTINNGKATVLNALGLAGDLTIYGTRNDVLVVRNVDGQITKERLNLQDAGVFNSDFYNLKQGDVVYVSANRTKQKTARLDPNTPIYISVVGILLTITALIVK